MILHHSADGYTKTIHGPMCRALGNRGNARTRQGRLQAALADFNAAIKLCPWAVDPVLNRSVVQLSALYSSTV